MIHRRRDFRAIVEECFRRPERNSGGFRYILQHIHEPIHRCIDALYITPIERRSGDIELCEIGFVCCLPSFRSGEVAVICQNSRELIEPGIRRCRRSGETDCCRDDNHPEDCMTCSLSHIVLLSIEIESRSFMFLSRKYLIQESCKDPVPMHESFRMVSLSLNRTTGAFCCEFHHLSDGGTSLQAIPSVGCLDFWTSLEQTEEGSLKGDPAQ